MRIELQYMGTIFRTRETEPYNYLMKFYKIGRRMFYGFCSEFYARSWIQLTGGRVLCQDQMLCSVAH
jgi:hypothetical protein